jgi:hypothetical protein
MNTHQYILKICSDYIGYYSYSADPGEFELSFCKSKKDSTIALKVQFFAIDNYNQELTGDPNPDLLDQLQSFECSNGKCIIKSLKYEYSFTYSKSPVFKEL